jgi:Tic22-like family
VGATNTQSLSLAALAPQRKNNVVADVALYNPSEIMARLSGICVYTVVNRKNEFVLASGNDEVFCPAIF